MRVRVSKVVGVMEVDEVGLVVPLGVLEGVLVDVSDRLED